MAYGHGMIYMIIAQVIFFIVTISLMIWFIRNSNQKDSDPKEILDRRLASGDIDKKEYNSLLKLMNR
ncbi:MAG: hypothetical protein PWQ28_731 [Candidatus Woesearchaeota archaeon]|nr:hypothetical protein [Candidatus Woesearchaeota archaeon]